MTTLRRGSTAAMLAGLAGLGLCAQALPASAAPTTTTQPAGSSGTHARQLTQNQASNLALQILGDHLRSDAVVLKRVPGDHSAQIVTNDASQQQDASISATWAAKGTAERPCTSENVCTASKLPSGTLYTYDELGTGFSYTYLRNDGAVINLRDLDGQVYWNPTSYHPVDDAEIANLLQDSRWNRVLAGTGSYVTPKKPNPPVTDKLAPSVAAQRIVTSYLVPEAKVASTTLTATSVTLATDGGVETGSWVKAEWMTRGTGPGQYDPDRDCFAKYPEWSPLDHEDQFGTGTLCEQTMPGYENGPQHDWYYTRGDGKVLHVSTMLGAYNGLYSEWTPVTDGDVEKMLLDPRWDVALRKLKVTAPTPQQQAADTAVAMLKQYRANVSDVSGISVDAAHHTASLATRNDDGPVGSLTAAWMKVGSGTDQFNEQRDCLSQPGGAENKATTVKLECSFTSSDARTVTYFFSHDWAGQDKPGTVIRLTVVSTSASNSALNTGQLETLFQDARWNQVTATL